MKFRKIYVEISDICGLNCSFCPSIKNTRGIMPIDLFEKSIKACSGYTKLIALHILGDPLKLANIKEYLKIASKYNINVEITTSGIYIDEFEFLLKPPIKQINISLDAIMEIESLQLRDKYFKKVFDFCNFRQNYQSEVFINLRVQARERNKELLEILKKIFNLPSIDINTKIGKKTIIVIKKPFLWKNQKDIAKIDIENYTNGFCYALKNHFGILANGDIVPCCIDSNGNIVLGNINKDSIDEIFKSNRVKSMLEGFKHNIVVESFCKICDYRKQFD